MTLWWPEDRQIHAGSHQATVNLFHYVLLAAGGANNHSVKYYGTHKSTTMKKKTENLMVEKCNTTNYTTLNLSHLISGERNELMKIWTCSHLLPITVDTKSAKTGSASSRMNIFKIDLLLTSTLDYKYIMSNKSYATLIRGFSSGEGT